MVTGCFGVRHVRHRVEVVELNTVRELITHQVVEGGGDLELRVGDLPTLRDLCVGVIDRH